VPDALPAWPEHDPAPEVTSLDPRPLDAPSEPLAVRKTAAILKAAGWEVRIGYARSWKRQPKTGTYRPIETFSVQAGPGHPSGWRVMAVYERFRDTGAQLTYYPEAKKPWLGTGNWSGQPGTWKWVRVRIVAGNGVFPRHAVSITDLKEFASVRGSVLPAWFQAIWEREEDKAERQKQAAADRPRKSGEGL
jgi:hypothetical protein